MGSGAVDGVAASRFAGSGSESDAGLLGLLVTLGSLARPVLG